jgi:hypothetical protein
MKEIRYNLQNSLDECGEDYTLKTNDELINDITVFGIGKTDFHTADIERLIKENIAYEKNIKNFIEVICGRIITKQGATDYILSGNKLVKFIEDRADEVLLGDKE